MEGNNAVLDVIAERKNASNLISALEAAKTGKVICDLIGPGKAIESWEELIRSVKKDMPYSVAVTIEDVRGDQEHIHFQMKVQNLTEDDLSAAVRISVYSEPTLERDGQFKVFVLKGEEVTTEPFSVSRIDLTDAKVSVYVMTDNEQYQPYTDVPIDTLATQKRVYRV